MKIPFNQTLATAHRTPLAEGRHVGTVIQIASLGDQPAFEAGNPPGPSIGVIIELAGAKQLSKKMRLIGSPYSKLIEYLQATLPDPAGYDGDEPLPLTLGRPVAVEVTVNGRYANIASFHRPESFELDAAPSVGSSHLVLLESPDDLFAESGRDMFGKLHRDIRSWISKRVKERT